MTIASADLERIDLTDHDRYAHAVPYADFDRLRREDPVHWHPERSGPGFWAVTRYHDVVTVAKDTATYSSEVGAVALEDLDPDAIEARKSMIDTDPPRHAELRRLVTADFTRRRVGLRADEVRQVVRTVLAPVLPTETFDAVQQIATAVPIRVLLRILGIPRADEELMISLGDRMIAGTDPDLGDEGTGADRYRLLPFRSPAALEMREYSAWFYAAARQHDDDTSVLARLAGARIGGEALSQADYDAMFLLLVVAGNETTRSALALGIEALARHPGQWHRLRGGADLDVATEEILRWTTPLHHFRRTATRDAVLRGRPIRAGDKVVIWYTSANRDEDIFADPYRFDLARNPNPQDSFGLGGPHRCLGEHLARLEIKVVLAELLRQVRNLELAGPPRRIRSNFTNGLKSLPVRVEPVLSPPAGQAMQGRG
jgi:cytochrome P450